MHTKKLCYSPVIASRDSVYSLKGAVHVKFADLNPFMILESIRVSNSFRGQLYVGYF